MQHKLSPKKAEWCSNKILQMFVEIPNVWRNFLSELWCVPFFPTALPISQNLFLGISSLYSSIFSDISLLIFQIISASTHPDGTWNHGTTFQTLHRFHWRYFSATSTPKDNHIPYRENNIRHPAPKISLKYNSRYRLKSLGFSTAENLNWTTHDLDREKWYTSKIDLSIEIGNIFTPIINGPSTNSCETHNVYI